MKFRVWDVENKKYLYTPQSVFDALVYQGKYVLECGFTANIRGEDVTIFEGDIFGVKHTKNKRVVRFNNQRGCFEISTIDQVTKDIVGDWQSLSPWWTDELFDKIVGNIREGVKDV